MLSAEACKSHPSSVTALTMELQTVSGRNISTRTVVHQELLELDFMAEQLHTRSPKITVHNAERELEWCKVPTLESGAVETFSLEWWVTLHYLAVWWISLDVRRTLPTRTHRANSEVWWRRDNDLSQADWMSTNPYRHTTKSSINSPRRVEAVMAAKMRNSTLMPMDLECDLQQAHTGVLYLNAFCPKLKKKL